MDISENKKLARETLDTPPGSDFTELTRILDLEQVSFLF